MQSHELLAATMETFAHLAPFAWALKLFALIAFILLMVMVVALLYSGEVQNSEKGPISFVSKSSLDDHAFHGPEPIITNNLDGKKAVCSVFFSYVDRRGRPRRKRLLRKSFQFKKLNRSPQRDKSAMVGFWNAARHDAIFSAIQDAEVIPDAPNLFSAGTAPPHESTPHIDEYFGREIQETRTVAVSVDTLSDLSRRHCQFLSDEFGKLQRIKRNRRGIRRLENRSEFTGLPNLTEDGHYFVEMKFAIDPIFVLTEHPDGQVKTTAWLTVLTSVFALFMQFIYNGVQ